MHSTRQLFNNRELNAIAQLQQNPSPPKRRSNAEMILEKQHQRQHALPTRRSSGIRRMKAGTNSAHVKLL